MASQSDNLGAKTIMVRVNEHRRLIRKQLPFQDPYANISSRNFCNETKIQEVINGSLFNKIVQNLRALEA